MMKRRCLACAVVVAGAGTATAQMPADSVGLWGAVDWSHTSLSLNRGPFASKGALGFRLGMRLGARDSSALARWRFGVEVAYGATDLRGMDSTTASFAFAHVDAGGIVTFRIARYLRLYGFGRYGGQRAEHLDNHEIWNYAGSGWATGVGIEVPLTPHGYGIDLGVQLPNGTFTDEERLKVIRGIRIPYRARMFYLGWGGPFTIDLFWR